MGQSRQERLDALIEQVARGQRELGSIRDTGLRESVRIALRLHRQPLDVPDAYTRLRIRARVMAGLRPHRPTLRDNAWTALWWLAKPAPYIVRTLALAALLAAAGAGATAASADTTPDDLLYPLKIAAEGVRLGLASAPEDRAVVELSIAEHRLGEAERLAANGRTSDALVASAMYSQHIAWAAAELAPQAESSDLASQLESRFAAQRERAQALATTLATSAKSAAAARIIEAIAKPSVAPGVTGAERVAETAVVVVTYLAEVADVAEAAQAAPTERAAETARSERAESSRTAHAAASQTLRPATGAERKASEVAKAVRKALEETKAAADKAKRPRK